LFKKFVKKKAGGWLASRFDLEAFNRFFESQAKKPLPVTTGWFHTFGSLALILLLSQVITGILLLIYYRPTIKEAFVSVRFIMNEAYMGWLYRQVHAWGANLMLIFVFLHMVRTYFMGSFKKPREITWMMGVLLFILTLVFGFTGYLLPWNQLAYWATTVGTEVAGAIPIVGEWLKTLMRGGPHVGEETLSRFFVIHVIILPWGLFFIVAVHLFLVRLQGIATTEKVGKERKLKAGEGIPFFPHHVLKEGVLFFIVLGTLITLSILLPFELGEQADPLITPHAIKPEWYFLPMYQVLKYFPKLTGIFIVSLAPLMLFFWPFIDRTPERDPRKRPVSVVFGILVLLSLVLFGMMGHFAERKVTIFGHAYNFDMYGIPQPVKEEASATSLIVEP